MGKPSGVVRSWATHNGLISTAVSTLNLSGNERANDPELDRNRLLKPVEVQAYNILWMRGTQCFMSVPASLISKTVSGSRGK